MGRNSVELGRIEGDGMQIGSGVVWIEIHGSGGEEYIGVGRHCRVNSGSGGF
jgi:hypothetical protein